MILQVAIYILCNIISQIIGVENEKNKISEELHRVKEELETCNEGNVCCQTLETQVFSLSLV